jgi:hypothetical protein
VSAPTNRRFARAEPPTGLGAPAVKRQPAIPQLPHEGLAPLWLHDFSPSGQYPAKGSFPARGVD